MGAGSRNSRGSPFTPQGATRSPRDLRPGRSAAGSPGRYLNLLGMAEIMMKPPSERPTMVPSLWCGRRTCFPTILSFGFAYAQPANRHVTNAIAIAFTGSSSPFRLLRARAAASNLRGQSGDLVFSFIGTCCSEPLPPTIGRDLESLNAARFQPDRPVKRSSSARLAIACSAASEQ